LTVRRKEAVSYCLVRQKSVQTEEVIDVLDDDIPATRPMRRLETAGALALPDTTRA
jgi:hypothetical protein